MYQKLLTIARQTITAELDGTKFEPENIEDTWKKNRATFVTLTKQGKLRGCIGSLEAHRSLIEDIQQNALHAAFSDPRFPPLTKAELADIKIEISILTPPQKLEYSDADDLLEKLKVGEDGVIIRKDWHSATYLPQVWEDLPNKKEFLSSLCVKAGLPLDAWRAGDLEVQTYEVEKMGE